MTYCECAEKPAIVFGFSCPLAAERGLSSGNADEERAIPTCFHALHSRASDGHAGGSEFACSAPRVMTEPHSAPKPALQESQCSPSLPHRNCLTPFAHSNLPPKKLRCSEETTHFRTSAHSELEYVSFCFAPSSTKLNATAHRCAVITHPIAMFVFELAFVSFSSASCSSQRCIVVLHCDHSVVEILVFCVLD